MRNTDDKHFDELLGKAFRGQLEKELNNGPTDETLGMMHPFTEEQMKRAEAMSRKHKKNNAVWKNVLGKAAAILLCLATTAGVITMSDPVVRGNVSNAVTHWIDEHISIDFSDAADDDRVDISKTRITYIPEGFALTKDNSDKDTVSYIYENEAGEYIIIDIEDSSDIKLMTDAGTHETEYHPIGGYEGYISYSDELNQGSVYFGSSYFTVAISGMTSRDELIKIAENIRFKD